MTSPRATATAISVDEPSVTEAAEVARAVGADLERGLTAAEAGQRLAQNGRNEVRGAPPVPTWRRVLAHFQDPLIHLLLAAIVIALAAWWLEGRVGWPVDAIVIAAVVLLNGALSFIQEAKARDAVAALARMTEATSAVMRDGMALRVPSAELVRGDLLLLGEGDAVGADARLVEATSLRVQEASLTGESEAVLKDAATLASAVPLGDRLNMVFKGTAVVQGSGRAVITATAMDTEMGAIATLLESTVDEPTPLALEVARIGRMLGIAVVIIAVVVMGTLFALSDIRGAGDVTRVLLLGVSLAVAAVPEGLPAILSVVLALGVQRMARHSAIVKNLSSVETLGSASVICSDKTGTLTRSEMTIERVMTLSGSTHVTGVGYAPEGQVEHEGAPLESGPLRAEQVVVLGGGSLAGNADLRQASDGGWEIHGDPTEAAFLVAERKLGVTERRQRRFERVAEVPFTSERKMMSSIERDHEHGDSLVIVTKGAPDVLLAHCTRARVGMDVVALDDALRARALADVDALTDAALRTLAVAYRPLEAGEETRSHDAIERDLIFVGTVGIIDPPRPEAALAIQEARGAGIRVIMITGDHPRTAARIAADLGIAEAGAAALSGAELDALDHAAFNDAVRTTAVFARVAPAHKLRIVAALQAEGHVVAMTGDGVNDAPALKAADIGVAMGITGTEVTKEAAKMILADDNFATIVQAVREGRAIFDNIRKFLRYLLSSNMGEVLTVFLGVVGAGVLGLAGSDPSAGHAVVLPLLATQILWINLVTDSGPALAMGVDPTTGDVMSRPPRRRDERVIDARMWRGVLQTGAVMAAVTLLTIDLYLPGGLIEGTHTLDNARTAGFTVLVLAQLFNCFNARSDRSSAFSHLFVNGWLWASIALAVLLQVAVVHVGWLNIAFGTVPLSLEQWALCVAMASGVLWASELRKLVLWAAGGSKRWADTIRTLTGQLEAARTHGEAGPPREARYDARELDGLPAPVQRYFRAVLEDGQPIITAATIEMAGTFNVSATGEQWKPFTSRQRVITRRPGFLWDAQVSMFAGVPARVVDSYVAGQGRLFAKVLGLFTVADARGGGEIARGEFMRWFAEAAWYPTALLPSQGVRWQAVDDTSAHATVSDGALTLTLLFRFDEAGLISCVHAEARGAGVGKDMVMLPWVCSLSNYQSQHGMLLPMAGAAAWLRPEGRKPYFLGTVTSLSHEFAR